LSLGEGRGVASMTDPLSPLLKTSPNTMLAASSAAVTGARDEAGAGAGTGAGAGAGAGAGVPPPASDIVGVAALGPATAALGPGIPSRLSRVPGFNPPRRWSEAALRSALGVRERVFAVLPCEPENDGTKRAVGGLSRLSELDAPSLLSSEILP
jgi:hypothetical protein